MRTQYDSFGNERPISYVSRPLTPHEKACSATKKEALTVIFTVDYFRVYLLDREFTLVTNHIDLRFLHSVEPTGRIACWVIQSQEHSFDITHRAGAHGNADSSSRLPSNFVTNCATSIFPAKSLQEAQMNDRPLAKFLKLNRLVCLSLPFCLGSRSSFTSILACLG